jgi:uncharacterized protein (DUF486 family)
MISAATEQFKWIINNYKKILPITTFPYIPLICAACFQVFAWFGGSFLGPFTLIPRVFILWLFAFGEYSIMSPSMNASVEVLNMPEPNLVVAYQVITLVVFTVLSTLVFKNKFQWKYLVSYIFLALAVYVAFVW